MKTYLIGATQLAYDHVIKTLKGLGEESPASGIDAAGISPHTPIGILSLLDGQNSPEQTARNLFSRGHMAHISLMFLIVSDSEISPGIRAILPDAIITRQFTGGKFGIIVTATLTRWVAVLAIPRSALATTVNQFLDQVREHFITIQLGTLIPRAR